jgi:NAD(P)-dependent dehydrogenase (short-subunit alcohol dehydrogenase family)
MYHGKTVLITGTSSGLGRDMAFSFAKQGAFVGMMARRLDRLQEMETEIAALGGKALALQVDVTNTEALHHALQLLIEKTGRLDVLVNNAGIGVFGRAPNSEEYLKIYDVNVHSVYRLSIMAIPFLEKTKGSILNIGSTVTERPFAGELVYNATKGAVTALTKAMAATYGKNGIRVNLIQPGVIASEFNVTAGLPPEIDQMAHITSEHLNALPATGIANDVAEAAVFICSDRARFITGEVLKVDGGITLAAIRP